MSRGGFTGRRARPAAACAVAALACVAGAAGLAPSAHAGVTPDLDAALRQALPLERIPVVATLRDQADPAPGDDPAATITALHQVAGQTQPGLLARVILLRPRTFWLVNAVAASAIPLEVRLLAADPAVASVDLDPAVELQSEGAQISQGTPLNSGLDAIHAPQAWRATGVTGASVRVGTIDTGIAAGHPALAGRIAGWRDRGRRAGGPLRRQRPRHPHRGPDRRRRPRARPVGVAPGAKLLVAKAIRGDGHGAGSDVLAAAQWLADPDDNPATADFPAVINNSWGQSADPNDLWFRPMLARWRALGIVPVFAAGNAGPRPGSVGSPSGYPEALAVGALDRDGGVAPFSSRGPVDWQNRDGAGPAAGPIVKPDLVAPGRRHRLERRLRLRGDERHLDVLSARRRRRGPRPVGEPQADRPADRGDPALHRDRRRGAGTRRRLGRRPG